MGVTAEFRALTGSNRNTPFYPAIVIKSAGDPVSGRDQQGADWHRIRVTAHDCPRISPEFLREEREALGPRWFQMEYLCEFTDAVDALFTEEDGRAALANDLRPLFGD